MSLSGNLKRIKIQNTDNQSKVHNGDRRNLTKHPFRLVFLGCRVIARGPTKYITKRRFNLDFVSNK